MALGGSGGNAAGVAVDLSAAVGTAGDKSQGILAQSIGGGGGDGGMAVTGTATLAETTTYTVAVGGSGGGGGTAGAVTVNGAATANVATSGTQSDAILAQSIGGGGGNGAMTFNVSESTTSSKNAGYALTVGGSGGSGNVAGDVTVVVPQTVTASGAGSRGVVAQSIGGGGNGSLSHFIAQTSESDTNRMSLAVGGQGGTGAHGALAQVATAQGGSVTTGAGRASRDGSSDTDAGHALVAQSIGGGGDGGIGITGDVTAPDNGNMLVLGLGGGGGTGGHGGGVSVTNTAGSIQVAADGASGIFAQSVGGGGGTGALTGSLTFGDSDSQEPSVVGFSLGFTTSGSGGEVDLTNTGSISTYYRGSHGLFGQSVGGSGGAVSGLAGISSASAWQGDIGLGGHGASGDGGRVSIVNGEAGASDPSIGNVTTWGHGASAIMAQSIGGGGGDAGDASDLTSTGNGSFSLALGGIQGAEGDGGDVSVEHNSGLLNTNGLNAPGIFAQSIGGGGGRAATGLQGASVEIYMGGASDGAMIAAGVTIADGSSSEINNSGTITNVLGASGVAIQRINANPTITNDGTITGSVVNTSDDAAMPLAAAPRTALVNHGAGLVNAGARLDVDTFLNQAALAVGGHGPIARTALAGDLEQDAAGRLLVDHDAENAAADLLEVEGRAVVGGTIEVNPVSFARSSTTVLTAAGGVERHASLRSTGSTHLFSFTPVVDSHSVAIALDADFIGAAGARGSGRRGFARYLQALWDEGATGFGLGFADLAGVQDGASYARVLDTMSGRALGAISAARFEAGQRFARSGFSCQAFAGETMLLDEQDCAWGRVVGADAEQDRSGAHPGYDVQAVTMMAGGQREVAPGWFLGGALGYETSRLNGDDGRMRVDGDAVLATASLKRQTGPLLLAGAVDFGYGWYDSRRRVDLPAGGVATASPRAWNAGLHLRAAYQLVQDGWYLQPALELDASYLRLEGYTERGAGVYDLRVSSSNGFVVAATPMVRVGTRVDLEGGAVLNAFAGAGLSLYGGDDWEVRARFANVSSSRSFQAGLDAPDSIGRFTAGVDVITEGAFNVRLQLDAATGSGYREYGGMLRVSCLF